MAGIICRKLQCAGFGGRVESGYRFGTPDGGLTPYAALQAQSIRTPTYSETDLTNGGFGLTYNGRTATGTRSEVGARLRPCGAGQPPARADLAWAACLGARLDHRSGACCRVPDAAGHEFYRQRRDTGQNSALASAGAELRLANGISLIGKFDGDFASRSSTYAGTGTLRYAW